MRDEISTRRAIGLASGLLLWSATAAAQTAPPRYGPPPAGTVPPPMQSGGLAPPPPMQSGGLTPPPGAPPAGAWPSSSSTAATLAEADRQDSGRGLEFFYLEPEVGAEYASLEALHGPLLPQGTSTSGLGVTAGAAAGVRLLFFTVGPRVRFAHFSDFDLLTIDVELGWRVPLGSLEPYGMLGGGYARLGGDLQGKTVDGYDFRLGGGVDYYVTSVLSVGGRLTAELLRLRHSAVSSNPPDAALGSTYGLGVGVTTALVLGLHF